MTGFVVCATPRSGSTLLCRLLEQAGAGRAHSFLRAEDLDDWAADWGLPTPVRRIDRAYLRAVVRAGTSARGVFGLRLMVETLPQIDAPLRRLYPDAGDPRARIEAAFGPLLFVHLARRDRLAQAVSLVRAQQTGLWHAAPNGAALEQIGPPGAPRYDPGAIRAALGRLEQDAAVWPAWFASRGISPVVVTYEELEVDPVAVADRICTALGLALDPSDLTLPTRRLADDLSRAWIDRFRAEQRA